MWMRFRRGVREIIAGFYNQSFYYSPLTANETVFQQSIEGRWDSMLTVNEVHILVPSVSV